MDVEIEEGKDGRGWREDGKSGKDGSRPSTVCAIELALSSGTITATIAGVEAACCGLYVGGANV